MKQAEGPLVMSAAASDVVAACRLFNFFLIDWPELGVGVALPMRVRCNAGVFLCFARDGGPVRCCRARCVSSLPSPPVVLIAVFPAYVSLPGWLHGWLPRAALVAASTAEGLAGDDGDAE